MNTDGFSVAIFCRPLMRFFFFLLDWSFIRQDQTGHLHTNELKFTVKPKAKTLKRRDNILLPNMRNFIAILNISKVENVKKSYSFFVITLPYWYILYANQSD